MANQSIFDAFERMWQHVVLKLGDKSDADHNHEISDVTGLQTALDELNEIQEFDLTSIGEVPLDAASQTSAAGDFSLEVMNEIFSALDSDTAKFKINLGGTVFSIKPNTIKTIALDIYQCEFVKTVPGHLVISITFVKADTGGTISVESYPLSSGSSSSGGSSVQPDWSQNDPTAADYVKNRTHWVEETLLLEETEITTAEEDGAYVYYPTELLLDVSNTVEGDTYRVIFDGTSYDSTTYCDSEWDMTIIGNGRVFGLAMAGDEETLDSIIASGNFPAVLGKGNGEPFTMIFGLNDTGMVFTEEAGTYTLEVYGAVYHAIDRKFLTPGLPWIEEGTKVCDADLTTSTNEYGNIAADNILITGDAVLTNGSTMKVICDDVEYESPVTLYLDGIYLVGNKYIYLEYQAAAYGKTVEEYIELFSATGKLLNDDTGEPFVFVLNCNDKTTLYYTKEATTYNIKIYGTVYHKMDSRYLPEIDALPTVSDTDDGKVLGVVNGEWSTTDAPSGLPEVTTEDNNKVLIVVDGVWTAAVIEYGDEVAY